MPKKNRFSELDSLAAGANNSGGKFGELDALANTGNNLPGPQVEDPSLWQRLNKPLWEGPSRYAKAASNWLTTPTKDDLYPTAVLKGFAGGALEGAGDLVSSFTSPFSAGLTLATMGAGSELPIIGKASSAVAKGMSGLLGAHGLYKTGEGIYNQDPTAVGTGALELAGAGLGYNAALPKPKAPVPVPVPVPEPVPVPKGLPPSSGMTEGAIYPEVTLNLGKEPGFIAGHKGVAKNAPYKGGIPTPDGELPVNLPPDLVAREGGTVGQGKDVVNVPSAVNLDAVKEAKRIAAIKGSQGWNGMVSLGKEPVTPDIPVRSGDTRGGFSEQSNANLPYPLNVVPNSVRPRTVQSVTEALTPERFKVDLPEVKKEPVTFTNPESQAPEVKLPTDNWQPPELPSAPKTPRIKTGNKVVDAASESPVPEIQQAAAQIAKESPNTFGSKIKQAASTMGTELKGMGDAGTELYRRASRYTQTERQRLAEWAEPYKNAIKVLSKEERANFGDYVEGRQPIPNDKVQAAVDSWREVSTKSGQMGVDSGLRVQMANGEKVPFQPIEENYWPRHLSKEELDKMPGIIDKMLAESPDLSRAQAEQIIKGAREYGELITSPQHQRLNRLFNYRKDAESGLIHLENMAKRTARSSEFGPLDTAGKGSEGIADIIEQTSDPKRAHEIMKRVVGREENVDQNLDKVVRNARTAVSWARLQNYALSATVGNQIPIAMKAGLGEWANSLKAVTTNWKASKAITDEAGALASISHGMLEELSNWNPMKLYGGEAVENLVRTQSAVVGRSMAKNFFNEVKKNPNNQAAMKELFELVLEDPKKVLAQKELTPEQLKMAAGRGAEIIQGLTAPVNLPSWASTPVTGAWPMMGQMMMVFKKQAMLYNKLMYDSMKANPARTTAILVGMGQLAGAAVGTGKSVVKGTYRGAIGGDVGDKISDELEHRSDYVGEMLPGNLGDSKLVRDAVDRQLQGWTLGLWGDLLSSSLGGKGGLTDMIAGPIVGGAANIAGDIASGNVKQVGREALRMAPLPGGGGSALQVELLPTQAQENRGKSGSSSRSRNRPGRSRSR